VATALSNQAVIRSRQIAAARFGKVSEPKSKVRKNRSFGPPLEHQKFHNKKSEIPPDNDGADWRSMRRAKSKNEKRPERGTLRPAGLERRSGATTVRRRRRSGMVPTARARPRGRGGQRLRRELIGEYRRGRAGNTTESSVENDQPEADKTSAGPVPFHVRARRLVGEM